MNIAPQGGSLASQSGKAVENMIYNMLIRQGFVVTRECPISQNIYGNTTRCDFFVHNITNFPEGLVIESKWQKSKGSVDEKYPFLVSNIKETYPCPAVIMADGNGARPAAIQWLKQQVDNKQLLAVFSLQELFTWFGE